MTDAPSNIRALQDRQELELTWNESRTVGLPYRFVRGECPCASCRDEWSGDRILDPATIRSDIKIEAMEPIGSYAVRILWNDGHSSGLFTWDTLLTLCNQLEAGDVT